MESFLDNGKLPDDKEIVDTMSRKAFEVESVEKAVDGDSLFEIKVLPNRAHDALSLEGMAKELAALFDFRLKPDIATNEILKNYTFKNDFAEIGQTPPNLPLAGEGLSAKGVMLRANKPVLMFSGLKVRFDNSKPTPDWIKDILEKSGGRSINCLVDITNLILFSFGQPAHVFDFDKLKGGKLVTRFANEGEELELLDGKKVKLTENDYVIADTERALSLAGIKGGKLAEVDSNTQIGVFEMANFNPTMIRKTSQRLGIRTDASKIFENGISTSVTERALPILIATLKEIDPSAEIEFLYQIKIVTKKGYKVGVNLEVVNDYAGKKFTPSEVHNLLAKLNFKSEYVKIADKLKQKIDELLELQKTVKAEYKLGASVTGDAPKYFDCSGLMSFLYKESGVQIPRLSIDQLVFGKRINKEELQFGDLVFTNEGHGHIWFESMEYKKGTRFDAGVSHVGMYLGEHKVLHISMTDNEIQVIDMTEGKKFTEEKVVGFSRVADITQSVLIVTPPDERLDIKIPEDVVEEALRMYGFDNIQSTPLNPENATVQHNTRFLVENYIKVKMFNKGFTEIFNYTFVPTGNVKVKLGLASDKEYLRNNLTDGARTAFSKNYNYMPIMETDILKFFEIGTVFLNDDSEEHRGVIAWDDNKKKTKYLPEIMNILSEVEGELGISKIDIIFQSEKPAMVEFSIDKIVEEINSKKITVPFAVVEKDLQSIKYKPISVYPFIVRDIAVWVPEGMGYDKIETAVKEMKLENFEKMYLFDTFSKDDKTSIAFRIIFQSNEKTLTDEEVEKEMQKVNEFLRQNNFEIR